MLAVIGPERGRQVDAGARPHRRWPLARGAVRLDGATLAQLVARGAGQAHRLPPQDVQLFDGTITENIARFEENPDSHK